MQENVNKLCHITSLTCISSSFDSIIYITVQTRKKQTIFFQIAWLVSIKAHLSFLKNCFCENSSKFLQKTRSFLFVGTISKKNSLTCLKKWFLFCGSLLYILGVGCVFASYLVLICFDFPVQVVQGFPQRKDNLPPKTNQWF